MPNYVNIAWEKHRQSVGRYYGFTYIYKAMGCKRLLFFEKPILQVVHREKKAKNSKKRIDYYPFGMPMPNRNLEGDYRYAYQGQEKDPETGKEAFELRLWDARIGRWLTTDPKREFHSPYLGMGNNPLNLIDPDGGSTDDWVLRDGQYVYDENITKPDDVDLQIGDEYIGAGLADVKQHFYDNLSFFDQYIRKPLGQIDISAYINYESYLSAVLTPRIENAFLRQRHANQEERNGFYPVDFSVDGINRDSRFFGINEFRFETNLCIEGCEFPGTAQFTVRSPGLNRVTRIEFIGSTATGGGHSVFFNAFAFHGKATGVIILELDNKVIANDLLDFLWDVHK